MRKSDKAFIYVSLGGIKGIYSRRELNVFASQSQQFDLFLIGLLDLLSHSCLNSLKASTGRDAPPGRYAPCVTVTGEERPLQRPGVARGASVFRLFDLYSLSLLDTGFRI